MRATILLLVTLSLSSETCAQILVELRNGKLIECKGWSIDDAIISIKRVKEKNLDISVDSVLRIHSIEDEETSVIRPIKQEYRSLVVKQDGDIKILTETFYTTSRYGSSASTSTYIQTADTVFLINYGAGKSESARIKQSLANLVMDNDDLVKRIDQEDFKIKDEPVEKLIADYNVSKWQAPAMEAPKGTVYVYLKRNHEGPAPTKVTVDDGAEFDVSITKVTMLNLTVDRPSKVCVNSHCELISGDIYYKKYVEIQLNEKSGEVVFEVIHSKKAKRKAS